LAIGNYLDRVTRRLNVSWDNTMPAAALEKWSQINETDPHDPLDAWESLPRPLSHFKKNVLSFSFSGILSAIDKVVLTTPELDEGTRKSLGRAGQRIGFEHVAQKAMLGIKAVEDSELGMKYGGEDKLKGSLVVSGGVASHQAFRKMCVHFGNT
jgi:tRNA A37 threonylcarbamoyltransferase TsaD